MKNKELSHGAELPSSIIRDQNSISSQIFEQVNENNQSFSGKVCKKHIKKGKQEWNKEDLELLINLYKQFGPSWTYFSTKLQNRSYRNIKNKFNNGLRKAAKILYLCEGQLYKNTKRSIKYKMLLALMNFVYQLEKVIKQNGFSVNYQSKIFTMRSEVLNLALSHKQFSKEMQQSLIKLIKSINYKIRCFGVFKPQNNKKWKLSIKGLKTICRADPGILLNGSVGDLAEQRESEMDEMIRQDYSLQSMPLSLFQDEKNNFDAKVSYEDFMSIERQISGYIDDGFFGCQSQSHLFY